MIDCLRFIEESKPLFNDYEIIDSKFQSVSYLPRVKGSCIAIAGTYFLNCQYKNEIYQEYFYLVVICDKTNHFVLPIVWLPNEHRPYKFEHMYTDNTCCLGTIHDIITIWGKEQRAEKFFSDIIDVFLINLLCVRRTGKCATGEQPHRYEGLKSYYSICLNMTMDECERALPILFERVNENRFNISGHNFCPCGGGERLRHCHSKSINEFFNSLYENKELRAAFIQDLSGYLGKGAIHNG